LVQAWFKLETAQIIEFVAFVVLIRYAYVVHPFVKKPETSHHSEEKKERWEELNNIIVGNNLNDSAALS
jgi:radical SAM superfamily enzyme YgiQ (UPF0313 family)